MIGPSDALGLGNRNSIAIDVDVFPLYACLPLRTSYLRPTCHQHLRWPRSDPRIAGRFRVAVVDSCRGLVDFHTHVLGMTDGLQRWEAKNFSWSSLGTFRIRLGFCSWPARQSAQMSAIVSYKGTFLCYCIWANGKTQTGTKAGRAAEEGNRTASWTTTATFCCRESLEQKTKVTPSLKCVCSRHIKSVAQ